MKSIKDLDIKISEQERARIRKRVLAAEKKKLDLKNPRGINEDIEQIIREEIK